MIDNQLGGLSEGNGESRVPIPTSISMTQALRLVYN
jgi:hypothetical protein